MGDVLGSLAWNADLGWWSGVGQVTPGHRIDLHVEAPNDLAQMRAAITRAGPAWERCGPRSRRSGDSVAGQLTDAHNRYCGPQNRVTPEQFAARLRLLSALFEASGAMELVYADGMLFGGHWIVVPIAPDGTVGEALEAG